MSLNDFITKVYPFKEIIPKDLVNNTLIYHMTPIRQDKLPLRQSKHVNLN
jgi:hypothetical protein